jgi:hypothetical protein
MTMNRLITSLVQLMLWAPILFGIYLAIREQKRMGKK